MYAQVADACNAAMSLTNHHDWVQQAANPLILGGDTLWQAMCAEWANTCAPEQEALQIARVIRDRLEGISVKV
jgi:hypothetical protein